MKKKLLLLFAFTGAYMHARSSTNPPFELWNKTAKPLYFAVHSSENKDSDTVLSEPLTELPSGTYVTIDAHTGVDISKYTRLLITDDKKSDLVTVYTFKPWKHIWVRQKEGLFGPQTGPLLGLAGTTERGYPLKENVTGSDFTSKEIKLSAWQKAKRSVKGAFVEYTIEKGK